MDSADLNFLADEILETAVLELDQEAVIWVDSKGGDTVVAKPYRELRNKIYDLLDDSINEGA